MEKSYTTSEVVEQLGNADFDFNDGEDSDLEGEGVHSLLPRASLDSVEDGDCDETTTETNKTPTAMETMENWIPPAPLVRATVIRTLPRVSPTLVQPRYKVW